MSETLEGILIWWLGSGYRLLGLNLGFAEDMIHHKEASP